LVQPLRLVRVATFAFCLLFALSLFVGLGSAQAATNATSTTNSAGISIQQRIVQIALSYRGYRYVYGGANPSTGFDCSGFAWWVYHQAGINFQRSGAANYVGLGQYVSRADLQPGDMIIYANTYVRGPSHVEIYLGNSQTIGADNPLVGVAVNNLNAPYWVSHYYVARRLIHGAGNGSQANSSTPAHPQANLPT
jgi:cell wall-associated NlpC family hydrolase